LGPVASRCLQAGARARLQPSVLAAAGLAAFGAEEVRALASVRLREVALLTDYLYTVPRLTSRRMLDLLHGAGFLGELERMGSFEAYGVARAAERAGWAPAVPEAHAALGGAVGLLAELGVLERKGPGYAWRGAAGQRSLALQAEDEARAAELFGGTLGFYRACAAALPDVLAGKPAPLGFGGPHAAMWDAVLGSPEQLLLRRLGLKFAGKAPRDALDLACGPGHGTACIAEAWPGVRITAIDTSAEHYPAVEERVRLSAAALGRPVELTLAKPWPGWGHELPFPDASFDLAFAALDDGFIPPHRRADVMAEVRRVLRPGGELLLVTATLPRDGHPPGAWELRAQTWFHHTVEFAVQGFHGLAPAEQHEEALRRAGFARAARKLAGLVWVARAP
jgi:SAM-dependent methyltransferase